MVRIRLLIFIAAFFVGACDGHGTIVDQTDAIPDRGREAGSDGVQLPESQVAEVPPETALVELLAEEKEAQGPACNPGEGCFLDKCTQNEQCQSGWCVDDMGEGVCSTTCQDECPAAWTCQQVAGTVPDVVFICVSNFANLCKPCNGNADCKSVGGADDVCVDYGNDGDFCGGTCKETKDCPWGFSCKDALTVDGAGVKQCLSDTGSCPCTAKSVVLAATTACVVVNESGTCAGKRTCSESGLSPCDAATPAEETCNGLDDNCDGDTDEPWLVEGKLVELCDDKLDCTKDSCKGADGCENLPLEGGECKDGDPCTVADLCIQGICVGTPVECKDDNPCTDDSCDQAGGCVFENNAVECDDGDACTVADQCEDGACAGFMLPCDCLADQDCAPLEDGNACNGTLHCNKKELPYKCEVEPATTVECPPPAGGPDSVCRKPYCTPETGECDLVAANNGFACDDGDLCTVGDKCGEGKCLPGALANCADDNPCTDDSCGPESGCLHGPSILPCDDGDVCTTGDLCTQGTCSGGAALDCDDGNPCTADSCTAKTGCAHEGNQAGCDDQNACTVGDHCGNGFCLPGSPLPCDDNNLCTTDACAPATGCVYALNNVPCDDGDVCTMSDHCQLGLCVGGQTVSCSDGNPCTEDSCSANAGCQFTPTAKPCNDQNKCTVGDQCAMGWCLPGPALPCDDGNLCTTDSCAPLSGCQHAANTAPCNDGNACTVNDVCQDAGCQGGGSLDCNDGNACTNDGCDPKSGCLHENNEAACQDGNACTTGDHCVEGACVPGAGTLKCSDGNPCTDDGCNPTVGCLFVNNGLACSDGNACTESDACSLGECVPGPAKVCPDDGNACTTISCDAAQGCVTKTMPNCCGNGLVESGEECDDGNQSSNDGCSSQCASEVGSCLKDWLVGTPCNGVDYGGGCTPQETGYHWKGIYSGYACWWNTKNQAWNSQATNPWHLAEHFGLDVNSGQVTWCVPFSGTPGPPFGGCSGYCDPDETHMWGWCGGAPFASGGWLCFNAGGKQPCK